MPDCYFFKQKTAYEMRSSDWSSDVCSSDLLRQRLFFQQGRGQAFEAVARVPDVAVDLHLGEDRKSVVSGKSVSVRVDLGGRRLNKNTISLTDTLLLRHTHTNNFSHFVSVFYTYTSVLVNFILFSIFI